MRGLGACVILAVLSPVVPFVDAAPAGLADAQFRYATFVGTVTDSNSRPVSGATVRATNTAHGLHRESTTASDGTYTMVNIQPGTYDFRISLGASTMFERRGIVVRGGDIARVNAQLKSTAGNASERRGPAPVADTRQVQVSLSTYREDGRPDAIAASGGADTFTAYITADAGLCSLRSGGEPDIVPGVGWRIGGRVLRRTNEAIDVRIDWQRLWENGTRQSNPRSGRLEATIRTGERFPLDSVMAAAGAACAATGGSLEATVIARAGRAGGGGPVTAPERTSAAAEELRQRAAAQYQDLVRLVPNALQVELWLVQTRPDDTENVQLITQPFGGSTSFVFPPVRVASDSGAVDVDVFGFLRHMPGDGDAGVLSLQVAIGRNLRQQGARPVESYSASGKTVPWPLPAEVLSFELPVSPSDQRVLGGHRFDLRLRLRPR